MMDRSKAKLRKKYEEERKMALSVVEEKKRSLELLGVNLA